MTDNNWPNGLQMNHPNLPPRIAGGYELEAQYLLEDFFDQGNKEAILDLIGIDYLKNKDDYEINLIFDNNSHIVLTTETIEVRLEDQNEIK